MSSIDERDIEAIRGAIRTERQQQIGYSDYVAERRLHRTHDTLATGITVGLLLAGAAFLVAIALQDGQIPRGLPDHTLDKIVAGLVGVMYCAYAYVAWQYNMLVVFLSRKDTSAAGPPCMFAFIVALAVTTGYYPAWPFCLAGASFCGALASWWVCRVDGPSPVGKTLGESLFSLTFFASGVAAAGVVRLYIATSAGNALLVYDGGVLAIVLVFLVLHMRLGVWSRRRAVVHEIEEMISQLEPKHRPAFVSVPAKLSQG